MWWYCISMRINFGIGVNVGAQIPIRGQGRDKRSYRWETSNRRFAEKHTLLFG